MDGQCGQVTKPTLKLTSGVARKERNSLCGLRPRKTKRDITWKLPLRARWFSFNKPRKSDEAGPWIIVLERSREL